MEYTAAIKETPSGWYVAQCEQMPEAITQGRTIDEVIENLKDAMSLLMEDEMEDFRQAHKGEKFIRKEFAVL